MSRELIPSDVKDFIIENIQSVFQLEVLLLLHKNSAKEWSAAKVDYELRIGIEAAAVQLEDLCSRGLLSARPAAETLYRYRPSSSLLDNAVNGLSRAYAGRRMTVLSLIFSKPVSNIDVFVEPPGRIKDDD